MEHNIGGGMGGIHKDHLRILPTIAFVILLDSD